MDSAWWAPSIKLGDEDRARPMFVERSLPGCIIVNQQGKRYMNESASYHVAGGEMMRKNSDACATIPSWFIFDAKYRGNYPVGPLLPGPPATDSMVKASMKDIMSKGDTIADLAEKSMSTRSFWKKPLAASMSMQPTVKIRISNGASTAMTVITAILATNQTPVWRHWLKLLTTPLKSFRRHRHQGRSVH